MKEVVFTNEGRIEYSDFFPELDFMLRDKVAAKKFKLGEHFVLPKEELTLVEVGAASICGTDLHILEGTHGSAPPVVLGHEYVGRVAEVGSSVGHIRVGDFVAVDPNIKCGLCDFCRRGFPNHCENMSTLGIFINGGFAPWSVVPAKQLYRLPETMPLEKAVFFEPLSCIMHSFENVEPRAGDNVLIYGGGTIGCLFVLVSFLAGASRVVVVEPSEYRREFLKRIGAEGRLPGEEPQDIRFDVVIDACGVPSVVPRMIEFARHGGRISLFGQQNTSAEVVLNPTRINQKELRLFGSYATVFNFERTIRVLEEIPCERLITHTFSLADFQQAFDLVKRGEAVEIVFMIGGKK